MRNSRERPLFIEKGLAGIHQQHRWRLRYLVLVAGAASARDDAKSVFRDSMVIVPGSR
jgi:hypothetical protein